MIINIICIVLVSLGIFFFLGGAIGIIRFPDFYTRMHAASKGDTMSIFLIFAGISVYLLRDFNLANVLVSGKILFIIVFIMLTSPTSTHALIKAGLGEGQKVWTRKNSKGKSEK